MYNGVYCRLEIVGYVELGMRRSIGRHCVAATSESGSASELRESGERQHAK